MQYSQTRAHHTMMGLTVQHLSTSFNYDNIIQLAAAEVILKYGFLLKPISGTWTIHFVTDRVVTPLLIAVTTDFSCGFGAHYQAILIPILRFPWIWMIPQNHVYGTVGIEQLKLYVN